MSLSELLDHPRGVTIRLPALSALVPSFLSRLAPDDDTPAQTPTRESEYLRDIDIAVDF